MPAIFSNVYHEAPGIGGLNYIALGLGLGIFSQLNARYMDKIYVYLKNKNNGVGEPEFRVRELPTSSPLLQPADVFPSCDDTRIIHITRGLASCRMVR